MISFLKALLRDFSFKKLFSKATITSVFKSAIFLFVTYIGLLMATSTDPETNWLIKFIGFGSLLYFSAKFLYPEKFL